MREGAVGGREKARQGKGWGEGREARNGGRAGGVNESAPDLVTTLEGSRDCHGFGVDFPSVCRGFAVGVCQRHHLVMA